MRSRAPLHPAAWHGALAQERGSVSRSTLAKPAVQAQTRGLTQQSLG